MERQRLSGGYAHAAWICIAAVVMLAIPLLVSGCAAAPSMSEPAPAEPKPEPDPEFKPTRLAIPPTGAAHGSGSIASPVEEDYFEFVLDSEFGSVTVMTSGTTDTAAQVETADRTPVTEYCDEDDPEPPCIFLYHSDNTGMQGGTNRAQGQPGVESSTNFLWIGKLAPATYRVRVTAERLAGDESGSYGVMVEPSAATPEPHPEPAFEPTLLEILPDAAVGADFIAQDSIESPEDVDYFKLSLRRAFNTVTIMTAGDTDTAGQVETLDRTPITVECVGERHEATPPCVWGTDTDIDTPNQQRSRKFNSMEASKNFIWEGSLDEGTYYIRVTGQSGATGPYELAVEIVDMMCPPNDTDPFGYYCDD